MVADLDTRDYEHFFLLCYNLPPGLLRVMDTGANCARRGSAFPRRSENERRGNVGSQQQRSNSAVKSPRATRGRRVHAAGRHMIATRTPLQVVAFARRPHGVYGDVTASLPRPHGASTAFALRLHRNMRARWHAVGAPHKRHGRRGRVVTSPRDGNCEIIRNIFQHFRAIPRRSEKLQIAAPTPWDRGRVWQGLRVFMF